MATAGESAGSGASQAALLSIGQLAARTGLTPTGLRMWEERFGFPRPQRLPGGHRRYTDHDARLVAEVVRRRDEGRRLEDAIALVLDSHAPTSPSVFATLRTRHPHLEVHRLRKTTLLAMSWAIEDEVASLAERAVVWGAFQEARFYKPSSPRWRDLARVTTGVTVLADFAESVTDGDLRRVALPAEAPMLREWAVVVDSATFPVALSAWEPPGQAETADRNRMFETIWTLDPVAVRDAARVCAQVARDVDAAFDRDQFVVPPVIDEADRQEPSLARVTGLFTRLAEYVDRFAPVDRSVSTPPLPVA